MVAKAELHVHLEGTAPPELIARIAQRNGVALPDGMLAEDGQFHYTNFLHFLQTYDLAASVIRTAEDYRDITYDYLAAVAQDGGIYVELTASPDHAALVGLSDEEHYAGIAAGIDDARRDHGIEARILVSAVRNFGAEQAVRVARQAAQRPHPYVVGFALAGDETRATRPVRRGVCHRGRRRARLHGSRRRVAGPAQHPLRHGAAGDPPRSRRESDRGSQPGP